MSEFLTIVGVVVGFLVFMWLVVPWLSFAGEGYWDWCRRKQREIRRRSHGDSHAG
jgi:hypothetical protein